MKVLIFIADIYVDYDNSRFKANRDLKFYTIRRPHQ